jgi:cyanophycin synthetase
MTITTTRPGSPATADILPSSVADWRDRLRRAGAQPVIAVAGSRGKSTVIHLLDAMLTAAGLRTVLWTDHGVTINGRKQRGELVPWTRGLSLMANGDLDVAIQELDWDTVHAVGLPPGAYPVVAVTNLCANNDACLLQDETLRAIRALKSVRTAAHPEGIFILNGDDWAVAGGDHEHDPRHVLVTLSRDTPLVRSHLGRGGVAGWIEDGMVRFGTRRANADLLPLAEAPLAHHGMIGFQAANLLTAAAIARACGVDEQTVASAVTGYVQDPMVLPGSFNVIEVRGATAIVDRPAAPWFMRVPLRAIGHLPATRHVRMIGAAAAIPEADLTETGRLLGRSGGLLVLHGEQAHPERAALLLQGIAQNDVPPVVIHAETESEALSSVLRVVRPEDVLYIIADDPRGAVRRLVRSAKAERARQG